MNYRLFTKVSKTFIITIRPDNGESCQSSRRPKISWSHNFRSMASSLILVLILDSSFHFHSICSSTAFQRENVEPLLMKITCGSLGTIVERSLDLDSRNSWQNRRKVLFAWPMSPWNTIGAIVSRWTNVQAPFVPRRLYYLI